MSESRKKKNISFAMFTSPAYYNIRDPAGERFPVEEDANTRLRIHARGHPQHKEPRPSYAKRSAEMKAVRNEQSEKFNKMLDFIVEHERYFERRILESFQEKYRNSPDLLELAPVYVHQLIQRYFHHLAQKPDEYHADLFEPMKTREDVLRFSNAIVAEIMELPLHMENEPEVPKRLIPMPGSLWRKNQFARGSWGEPLNIRMAERGKRMKQLTRKAKLYQRFKNHIEKENADEVVISQKNAHFIQDVLGLDIHDPELFDKLKPTEEEEEMLLSIAQEGGRRKNRKTRIRKTRKA